MARSNTYTTPGWMTIPILGLVLISPVGSLVDANWVERSQILYWPALAALLVGYVVARLPLPKAPLHVIAVLGGLAWSAYLVSTTIPKPDSGISQMADLYRRLSLWFEIVATGGYGNEPYLFLLLLAAGVWLNSYIATWVAFRHKSAIWAFAAGGATLVVNVSWAIETLIWVVPFGIASLVLAARLNLLRQEEGWRDRRVRYNPDVWSRTFQTGLVGAIMIVGVGWYTPEIPPNTDFNTVVQSVSDRLQPSGRFQNEFNRLFGGIRIRGVSSAGVSGFGNQMSLGGQFTLGDSPILRVRSVEPHYWRALIYERYTGRGWSISPNAQLTAFEADVELPVPDAERRLAEREELTQTVEVLATRGDRLVVANRPVEVSIATQADMLTFGRVRPAGQGTPVPAPVIAGPMNDFIALHGDIGRGSGYTVTSSITRATPDMLRSAGSSYPRDVVSRYTALPNSPAVPARVRQLATDLTEGKTNAYDKAKAVEAYLRTLNYSLQVPAPPSDVDGVEYFLFDIQTGYCDYFASAMAVMMRSVGVPARVASGYAVGEREEEGVWLVRDSNAHSWVEIYFPNYGWVEFEPTPSRPLLEQLNESIAADLLASQYTDIQDPEGGMPFWEQDMFGNRPFFGGELGDIYLGPGQLARTLAIAVLAILLIVVAVMAAWRAGLAGLAPPAAAYQRVAQLARLLGWRARPEETPRDYGGRLARTAPAGAEAIGAIAESFTAERYGKRLPNGTDIWELDDAWQSARQALISVRPEQLRARWDAFRHRGKTKSPSAAIETTEDTWP